MNTAATHPPNGSMPASFSDSDDIDHPAPVSLNRSSMQSVALSPSPLLPLFHTGHSDSAVTTAQDKDAEHERLSQTLAAWRYLSEGRMHIVLTHVPTTNESGNAMHDEWAGCVIKISKSMLRVAMGAHASSSTSTAPDATQCTNQLVQMLHESRAYTSRVMTPLLHYAHRTMHGTNGDSIDGPTSSDLCAAATSTASTPPTITSSNSAAAWLDNGRIVWVAAEELEKLIEQAQPCRPSHRVEAFPSFISGRSCSSYLPVLLFEDYTSPSHLRRIRQRVDFKRRTLRRPETTPQPAANGLPNMPFPRALKPLLPTICLELKPKAGYLPCASSFLHHRHGHHHHATNLHDHHRVKLSTCRYCMYQHLKVKKGEVSCLSSFCPLDLFSCDPPRVRRAFEGLFRTPQNNMRIFVRRDGIGIHEPMGSTAATKDGGWAQQIDVTDSSHLMQLAAILFPHSPPLAPSDARDLLLSFFTSFVCSSSLRTFLLQLRSLQAALDAVDVQAVHTHAYETLCKYRPDLLTPDNLWHGVHQTAVDQHDTDESTHPAWLGSLLSSLKLPSLPSLNHGQIYFPPSSTFSFPSLHDHDHDHASDAHRSDDSSDPSGTSPACARHRRNSQAQPHHAVFPSTQSPSLLTQHDPSIIALHSVQIAAPPHPVSLLPFPSCSSAASCPAWSAKSDIVRTSTSNDHGTIQSTTEPDAGMCLCPALQCVRAFLMATTLKDLSIMCTMQTEAGEDEHDSNSSAINGCTQNTSSSRAQPHSTLSSTSVHYSIRLIDLDRKSIGKMDEYKRLDEEIVRHFVEEVLHKQVMTESDT